MIFAPVFLRSMAGHNLSLQCPLRMRKVLPPKNRKQCITLFSVSMTKYLRLSHIKKRGFINWGFWKLKVQPVCPWHW
jgi:hypothetical protein